MCRIESSSEGTKGLIMFFYVGEGPTRTNSEHFPSLSSFMLMRRRPCREAKSTEIGQTERFLRGPNKGRILGN